MHPFIQSPRDRQLILGSGVRMQSAGYTAGGVESQYAVGFDGSNDYIALTDDAAYKPTTGLSVSVWIKTSSASVQRIWDKQSGFPYYGYGLLTVNGKVYVECAYSANSYGLTSVASVNTGLWVHVTFAWDGTTGTIYINGAIDISYAMTGPLTYVVSEIPVIGGRYTGLTQMFNGLIDDLRIYNRAITAAEIQSIYRNSSSPPTDGLVAYFPMDEGTGTTTTDTVGGLVGTLTNGPTWQPQVCPRLRSGREIATNGWGVQFDGVNDYVSVPSSALWDFAGDFALTAWIKPIGSTNAVILGRWANPNGGWLWNYYHGVGEGLRFDYANTTIAYANALLSLNSWHHVAVTRIGSTVTLFADGVSVATGTLSGAMNNQSGVGFAFGRDSIVSATNQFNGHMRGVGIYTGTISAADIAKLANNVPISTQPVGWWKLDDGSGVTATDSSGNGNNGTLTNGPTWTADIPQWYRSTIESSYAGSFDGVDDYVSVPGHASLSIGTAGTFTIWCKPTALTGGLDYDTLVSSQKYYTVGYNGNFVWRFRNNASVSFASYNGQSNEEYKEFAVSPALSAWHHMAFVLNGTIGVLYVDNNVIDSMPHTKALTDAASSGLFIGNELTHTNQPFDGGLDEVCLYNIALPAAAILDASMGYLISAGLVARYKLDGNANDAVGSNNGTEQGGVTYSSAVPGTL